MVKNHEHVLENLQDNVLKHVLENLQDDVLKHVLENLQDDVLKHVLENLQDDVRSKARSRKLARRRSKARSRKQKKVNIDVIFYGQPYYNAVIKGDFTKINKHIDEFNKLFKRKIGQSGPYGEHVTYVIDPADANKFRKKAREIFGKLKLHVSFDVSKSLKYLDKSSGK
jgi:hypothetical protein